MYSLLRKAAFTLAEALITLTIIGLISALVVSVFNNSIHTKVTEAQVQAYTTKFSQVMQVLQMKGVLTKTYDSTAEFLTEMAKYANVAQICDENHLTKCFGDRIMDDPTTVKFDVKNIRSAENINAGFNSEVGGVVFSDGSRALIAYNHETPCAIANNYDPTLDLFACLAVIYDLNGREGSSTIGDDVGGYNVDKWMYNKDTGKYDADINIISEDDEEYQRIEYIESTGTQYIDTGIYLSNNHSVEIVYQLIIASQSRKGLYGGLDGARNGVLLSPANKQLEAGYGSSNVYFQFGMPDTIRHVFKQEKNKFFFDGVLVNTFPEAAFKQNFTAPLGNFNYINYAPASAKYYASKWWDDDVLVRNFIPVIRKSDNKAGMYDKVQKKFYVNSGSGDFIAGPKK